jgi:hypothetical protein
MDSSSFSGLWWQLTVPLPPILDVWDEREFVLMKEQLEDFECLESRDWKEIDQSRIICLFFIFRQIFLGLGERGKTGGGGVREGESKEENNIRERELERERERDRK